MRACLIIILFQITSLVGLAQDAGNSKSIERPDLPGKLMLDFGYNNLRKNLDEDNLKRRLIQSKSFSLSYMREHFFFNTLSVNLGAGLTFEKLSFEDNKTLSYETGVLTYDTVGFSIKKSKLAMNYIQVPVDFRFYPSGRGKGSRFFVGVGAYAAYMFSSHTKLVNPGVDNAKLKLKRNFGVNEFRYGLSGKLGFDSFHLVGKVDLSNLFNPDKAPVNINANLWSLGISIDTF